MTQHSVDIPVLETERLILRAPAMDDLPAVIEFYTSESSHRVGGPLNAVNASLRLYALLGHWMAQGYGTWHIVDRDTGAWLGRTGFIFAAGWAEPELGWALAAQAEGRGIAQEATLAAREYGAQHLGLTTPISYIRPDNARSVALANRLGATFESEAEFLGKPCHIYRHPTAEEATA